MKRFCIVFSFLFLVTCLVAFPYNKSVVAETSPLTNPSEGMINPTAETHDLLPAIRQIPLTKAEMQQFRENVTNQQMIGEDARVVKEDLKSINPLTVDISVNKLLRSYSTSFVGADSGHIYLSEQPPRTQGEGGLNSNGWIDCRTEYIAPSATGSGYAWGWIGKYIDVTGSGSANFNITFDGRYEGVLEATNTFNTNTYCKIAAQVCDVTNDNFSIVAENVVDERGFSFLMIPNDVTGTIDSGHSIQTTLYAGHTYLLRLMLYTSAQTRWYTVSIWGLSDFHSGGPDGQGLDYNSVSLTW